MSFLDKIFKPKVKVIKEPTLADVETQHDYRQLLNTATSYIKSKEEVVEAFKSKSRKLNQYADTTTKKTIQDWRLALQAARDYANPNRYLLFDLFAELRLDPFLDSVVSYQKNKLTHIRRTVTDDKGNVDEVATKVFNSSWFDTLINGFVESQLNGFKVFEINQIVKNKGIWTIDRLNAVNDKHVLPEFQKIKVDAVSNNSQLLSYANDDYVIEIVNNDNRDLGKLSKLAPYMLWKKLAYQSWSNFIEDFSSPSMIIKTPVKNTDKENELLSTLENIGSSLKMVLDEHDDFQLVQPDNTDVYKVFQEMIKQVDDAIANEIVGGTLLFRNGGGGSYNLGSIQQSVSELKTAADLREIEKYTNQFLFQKLINFGVLKNSEYYLHFDPQEYISVTAKSEIIRGLAPFYDLDVDFVNDYLKVKINGAKNELPNNK